MKGIGFLKIVKVLSVKKILCHFLFTGVLLLSKHCFKIKMRVQIYNIISNFRSIAFEMPRTSARQHSGRSKFRHKKNPSARSKRGSRYKNPEHLTFAHDDLLHGLFAGFWNNYSQAVHSRCQVIYLDIIISNAFPLF